ncbi:unnamed protein product [Paramecium primaurelia]|uniref:Uncharacterized protein n=1 Tax=Paramecium primaurelia TaxID=5886 RepID=A0A8S1QMD9_PARPR|nr:unnamed protein product [Paramecium primaurelia]
MRFNFISKQKMIALFEYTLNLKSKLIVMKRYWIICSQIKHMQIFDMEFN